MLQRRLTLDSSGALPKGRPVQPLCLRTVHFAQSSSLRTLCSSRQGPFLTLCACSQVSTLWLPGPRLLAEACALGRFIHWARVEARAGGPAEGQSYSEQPLELAEAPAKPSPCPFPHPFTHYQLRACVQTAAGFFCQPLRPPCSSFDASQLAPPIPPNKMI